MVDLIGIKTTLEEHSRPGVVSCLFMELLQSAGYDHDEIESIALAMLEELQESRT